MSRSSPLIPLLLLALGLADLVIVRIAEGHQWPSGPIVTLYGLVLGQIVMATAAVVLGHKASGIRLAVFVGSVLFLAVVLNRVVPAGTFTWIALLAAHAVLLAAPLQVMRQLGYRWTDRFDRSVQVQQRQYSLAKLTWLVTAVALGCGSIRWTVEHLSASDMELLGLLCSASAFGSLLAVAVASSARYALPAVIGLLVLLLAGFGPVAQTVLLSISCSLTISIVLGVAGYQLNRLAVVCSSAPRTSLVRYAAVTPGSTAS